MTNIPEKYLIPFTLNLSYCFGNCMCSVNLRYWQNISFITERSQNRTRVLHVILGGRAVMNICIKLFQCGNCCILGYLIILKKKKRITVVLSDWCLRLKKKLHWVSWDSALLLTNMVVYISVIRNSHNRVLMDFFSPKGNLNNPWLIHQNRQTHCNYWYFYVWCYQRLKKKKL